MKRWIVNVPISDWLHLNWHDRMELHHSGLVDIETSLEDDWVRITGDHSMPWVVQQLVQK